MEIKNRELIENYYISFHDYLINTDIEKMSYKKLDKFINILYYDWPENMDLHNFVKYRKEYTKCPDYLSRAKLGETRENTDINFLPVLTPKEIFTIYSLDKCFELGTRYWCGMKYRVFCVDENSEVKTRKIKEISDLIEIMKKCRDEYLLGKSKEEINRKYGFDLSRSFNRVFSNIKDYRSIISKRCYDNIVHYNKFAYFVNEENEKSLNNKKDPFKIVMKNLLRMKPEKVIEEYSLDKIFDITGGRYPDFEYIFCDEDMALGF